MKSHNYIGLALVLSVLHYLLLVCSVMVVIGLTATFAPFCLVHAGLHFWDSNHAAQISFDSLASQSTVFFIALHLFRILRFPADAFAGVSLPIYVVSALWGSTIASLVAVTARILRANRSDNASVTEKL